MEATAAIVEMVHALVSWLAARHNEGAHLEVPVSWRIAENRWSALRDGVHGTLADLETGVPVPTARRLDLLLDEIEPHAAAGLDRARALIRATGADTLRQMGVDDATRYLTERFCP
jgi:carboxylate-amine ligase